MPRTMHVVYVDDKGKPVLQQNGAGRWDLVAVYGSVDRNEAKRLHAALGELLTDLAREPALAVADAGGADDQA